MGELKVFIGWDPREQDAYRVAEASLRLHASIRLDVRPLMLEQLRGEGLYARATERRSGRLWDVISGAPMSTEFALSRFLVPLLADWKGWALYCDCDFLFRADIARLLRHADGSKALLCVKHGYEPHDSFKMDGQIQTAYPRKNWSSFILWNCGHDAHAGQLERLKRWRGLWLHQFRWLQDEDIGELPIEWNCLDGQSWGPLDVLKPVVLENPAAVHFTRGTPNLPGYEAVPFADEWRAYLQPAMA